jgi:hypothetical protein
MYTTTDIPLAGFPQKDFLEEFLSCALGESESGAVFWFCGLEGVQHASSIPFQRFVPTVALHMYQKSHRVGFKGDSSDRVPIELWGKDDQEWLYQCIFV